jgi:hypothetical protein
MQTIETRFVSVEMGRNMDRTPWRIFGITVKGPMILKNGNVGAREFSWYYSGQELPNDAPELSLEYVTLAHKALVAAEADRTGVRPLCPSCGAQGILPAPTRPEETDMYCTPCGSSFPLPTFVSGLLI